MTFRLYLSCQRHQDIVPGLEEGDSATLSPVDVVGELLELKDAVLSGLSHMLLDQL